MDITRVTEDVKATHMEKCYQEIMRVKKETDTRSEKARNAKEQLRVRIRQIQSNSPDGSYVPTGPRMYEP